MDQYIKKAGWLRQALAHPSSLFLSFLICRSLSLLHTHTFDFTLLMWLSLYRMWSVKHTNNITTAIEGNIYVYKNVELHCRVLLFQTNNKKLARSQSLVRARLTSFSLCASSLSYGCPWWDVSATTDRAAVNAHLLKHQRTKPGHSRSLPRNVSGCARYIILRKKKKRALRELSFTYPTPDSTQTSFSHTALCSLPTHGYGPCLSVSLRLSVRLTLGVGIEIDAPRRVSPFNALLALHRRMKTKNAAFRWAHIWQRMVCRVCPLRQIRRWKRNHGAAVAANEH